jgi:hypothetical protein
MAKSIHAFPLSIYQDHVDLDGQYREALARKIVAQRERDAATTPGEAWSGEARGLKGLHRSADFDLLFDQLAARLRAYLKAMGLEGQRFTLYFAKSWGTVAKQGERLPRRHHPETHLGLHYCLRQPAKAGVVQFFQPELQNEFAHGIFTQGMMKAGVLTKPLPVNTSAMVLDAAEGDVAIYPAKTETATTANAVADVCVSVSALVMLTLKDSRSLEWGTPDPANWREF